jgi:surface-anchored protein
MSSISKRTLGSSIVAAMAVLFLTARPACADTAWPVYASGHCDICADYDDGSLSLHQHFHEEEPGLDEGGHQLIGEFDPAAIYTRASDATKTTAPNDPAYSFLGAPVGTNVWILSQNVVANQPYLGFGTEELLPADWSTNITYKLVSMRGPGQFSMWEDNFGTLVPHWATSDGIGPSDVYAVPPLAHRHASWGFTAQGIYRVQIQVSGTLADGTTQVTSNPETFTFLVGSSTAIPLPGDADDNGTVNGADLNVVLSNYNQSGMDWMRGDFNADRTVNGADLNTVLSNYNRSVSISGGAAVPEPSAFVLLGGGILGLLAWRVRRREQ